MVGPYPLHQGYTRLGQKYSSTPLARLGDEKAGLLSSVVVEGVAGGGINQVIAR
jgi:hypothetical protein